MNYAYLPPPDAFYQEPPYVEDYYPHYDDHYHFDDHYYQIPEAPEDVRPIEDAELNISEFDLPPSNPPAPSNEQDVHHLDHLDIL